MRPPPERDGPRAQLSRPLCADDLHAREGALGATIQWGEAEGDEPLLLHTVTLPLEPLRAGDEAVGDPVLELHSLRLPVASWRELEGASFQLGNVVRELSADGGEYPIFDAYGTLKLGETYHEVLPALLRFGSRARCTLGLHLEGHLRATDRPPSFAPIDLTLDADVVLSAVAVAGDSAADDVPAPDEARALAARLLTLDDYEPPVIEGGCTVLRPRCGEGA